jgi:hypothetical protein
MGVSPIPEQHHVAPTTHGPDQQIASGQRPLKGRGSIEKPMLALPPKSNKMSALRPHIGHSGCRYAILKAAIRYLPWPTPAEEKDNGIF